MDLVTDSNQNQINNKTFVCNESPMHKYGNIKQNKSPKKWSSAPVNRRISIIKAYDPNFVDRRRSIINSWKMTKKIREKVRQKAKQQRSEIFNKMRQVQDSSDSSDADDTNFSHSICQQLDGESIDHTEPEGLEKNWTTDKSSLNSTNLNDFIGTHKFEQTIDCFNFENVIDTKECLMPFSELSPVEITQPRKVPSSTGGNRSQSKTIYSDPIINNPKIPYMNAGTSMTPHPSCMSLNHQKDKITLTEIRSWNRLDTNIQAIIVFFIICLSINLYYLIVNRQ